MRLLKAILCLIGLALAVSATAQTGRRVPLGSVNATDTNALAGSLKIGGYFFLPSLSDTTTFFPSAKPSMEGAFVYRKADGQLYYFNGTIWQKVSGSGGSGGGDNNYPMGMTYNTATGLLTITRNGLSPITATVYADTTGKVASKYYLQGQLQNLAAGFDAAIVNKMDSVLISGDSLYLVKLGVKRYAGKLFPSQTGQTGKALLTNGTNTYWGTVGGGGGTYTASNGLTMVGNDTRLGGTLTQTTNIDGGGNDVSLTNTGDLKIVGGISLGLDADTLQGSSLNATGYTINLKTSQSGVVTTNSSSLNLSYASATMGRSVTGSKTFINTDSVFVSTAIKPSLTTTDSAVTRVASTGRLLNSKITIAASAVTTGTFPAARFTGTTTDGYILTLVSGVPTWSAASGGGGGVSTVNGVSPTSGNVDVALLKNGSYNFPLNSSGDLSMANTSGYIKNGTTSVGVMPGQTSISVLSSGVTGGYTFNGNYFGFSNSGYGTMWETDVQGRFKFFSSLNGQYGSMSLGKTGIAASCAVLDISATDAPRGVLMPGLTATQASALPSPQPGVLFYVNSTNTTFTATGFWYYNSSGTFTQL